MAPTDIVGAFFICYNLSNKEVTVMFRNNNFGFEPMYPYTAPVQYPMQMQQMPAQNIPNPLPMTNTNKIFVNGVEDVRSRSLPQNSDYVFLDNDKPLLYQKVVDAKGQFEVKVFDITPHQDTPVETPEYVLRADFDNVLVELTAIKDKLAKLGGTTNESFEK